MYLYSFVLHINIACIKYYIKLYYLGDFSESLKFKRFRNLDFGICKIEKNKEKLLCNIRLIFSGNS